jgi:hypothetical protein
MLYIVGGPKNRRVPKHKTRDKCSRVTKGRLRISESQCSPQALFGRDPKRASAPAPPEPCQTVWSTAAPGVKPVLEPQGASTREVEPRKRGSIRLHLPFTVLPPAVRSGGGAGRGVTNRGGGAAGQRRGDTRQLEAETRWGEGAAGRSQDAAGHHLAEAGRGGAPEGGGATRWGGPQRAVEGRGRAGH